MPEMDGFELLRRLRSSGYNLPVLMLTAKQTLPDIKQGLRLGADDYMTKPADEEEMLLRIAALLRRAQAITERKLTRCSPTIITPWSGEEKALSCPKRNFCCFINSCPIPTRPSPAVS